MERSAGARGLMGGRVGRCLLVLTSCCCGPASGCGLAMGALSEREFGRGGGGHASEKPVGGGDWSGGAREATLQLSMARMRIGGREDGAVSGAGPESLEMVVWDPRAGLDRETQEQKAYCRLYASCWWWGCVESVLLCVRCRLQVLPSNEANAGGRRGSGEQLLPDRWGDFQDSFAAFKPVDVQSVPEAVVPTAWVDQLVRESGRRLASMVQEMPISSIPTEDMPCLDEWYGSASDFAYLRRRLQQLAPSIHPKQSQEPRPARLRRVLDISMTIRESKHDFLGEQSAAIFKSVLRKNLNTMFIADMDVPDILQGELVMTALHHMQTESDIGGTSTNLRQVILTPRLLAEDEAKLKAAPGRIIAESDRLLKALVLSPISLTRATMAVPSFWRQQSVLTCLPDYESEERHANSAIETADTSPEKINDVLAVVAKAGDPATVAKDGVDQNASKQASHAAESPGNSTARSPALKLKDIPDSEAVGTDYLLSDMFMRCDWAGESMQTNGERTSTPPQPDDHEVGKTLEDNLNRLARPALWELARKKLWVIRNVSMQEALATADLGKLQATICQLLAKTNNIRLNPEVATHEEVVEVCTSFREALWVHTLRYVFRCNAFDHQRLMATIAQIGFVVRAVQQGTTINGFQSPRSPSFQHQEQASSGCAILEATTNTIRLGDRIVMWFKRPGCRQWRRA